MDSTILRLTGSFKLASVELLGHNLEVLGFRRILVGSRGHLEDWALMHWLWCYVPSLLFSF